jgi:hypothetical protein
MIDASHVVLPIRRVLADAEFDSERNHRHVRALGAASVIPAKRSKATWQRYGVRAQMWPHCPRRQYRRRNLIESVFSAIKRKLSPYEGRHPVAIASSANVTPPRYDGGPNSDASQAGQ